MHWDHELALPIWTAPAERQRRRRFWPAREVWTTHAASKSGVALRFPPQSKTWRQFRRFMERENAATVSTRGCGFFETPKNDVMRGLH